MQLMCSEPRFNTKSLSCDLPDLTFSEIHGSKRLALFIPLYSNNAIGPWDGQKDLVSDLRSKLDKREIFWINLKTHITEKCLKYNFWHIHVKLLNAKVFNAHTNNRLKLCCVFLNWHKWIMISIFFNSLLQLPYSLIYDKPYRRTYWLAKPYLSHVNFPDLCSSATLVMFTVWWK